MKDNSLIRPTGNFSERQLDCNGGCSPGSSDCEASKPSSGSRLLKFAVVAAAFTMSSSAIAATQYISNTNQSDALCRVLELDLKKARLDEMTDEQLCAVDVAKLIPEITFFNWTPTTSTDVDGFFDRAENEGHLAKDSPRRYDRGARDFVMGAMRAGKAEKSHAETEIGGHKLSIDRIDVDSCRSFDAALSKYSEHVYREQLGLPAYIFIMDGAPIPLTTGADGEDIGSSKRGGQGFFGVALQRAWTTVDGYRSISVKISRQSLSIPTRDSRNPLDISADRKPYFWTNTTCVVTIKQPIKEARHG
ncbi:hypothetical protein [Pinirhizobacter soli]|uniref:hypothetical protein n=1 Tax=Pinirhizobacter soli TaxID=2786953 RepID=UPI00202A97EB|nr:hypothetical protein [Pinirhizobacter soli]